MSDRLALAAPAKLNLGLEVIGRRPDGYHEIVTIMQTVTIFDRLTIGPPESETGLTLDVDRPELAGEDNLVLRAARLLRERAAVQAGARLTLRKEIPAAAGLGGASSDAAAALRGLAAFWSLSAAAVRLPDLAAELGSDVPFFLRGGTALAEGRGERLTSLPPLTGLWFVVVVPALDTPVPRKTATLYALLRESDFSAGRRVLAQAKALAAGGDLDPASLANAFSRPLYSLRPELDGLRAAILGAGAPFAALSGAGPAHYTASHDHHEAQSLAGRIHSRLDDRAQVFVCRPLAAPPAIEPQ